MGGVELGHVDVEVGEFCGDAEGYDEHGGQDADVAAERDGGPVGFGPVDEDQHEGADQNYGHWDDREVPPFDVFDHEVAEELRNDIGYSQHHSVDENVDLEVIEHEVGGKEYEGNRKLDNDEEDSEPPQGRILEQI